MSYPADSKPPLHKRFNEEESLIFIRNRYKNLKEDIFHQVEILKWNPEFRRKCQEYYAKGYKDWIILSAIFNLLLTIESKKIGLMPNSIEINKQIVKIRKIIKSTSYEIDTFLRIDFKALFSVFFINSLNTYGFNLRRNNFSPDFIESFLRERMRYFDYDLEHQAIFGEPPGSWPTVI